MIRQIDFIISKCRIWYDYVTCGIIANIYNTQTISYESKIHPTVSVLPYDTRFVQIFQSTLFSLQKQFSFLQSLNSYLILLRYFVASIILTTTLITISPELPFAPSLSPHLVGSCSPFRIPRNQDSLSDLLRDFGASLSTRTHHQLHHSGL